MNEMFNVPSNVVDNVKKYFEVYLPQYTVKEVIKRSHLKYDWHIYMVIVRKKEEPNIGKYTVWTSWNEKTQKLSQGHHGIDTKEKAIKLAKEFYTCY